MRLLAAGATAGVYAYGPDTILKLYFATDDGPGAADLEYANSRLIYDAGFPSPEPLGRVEVAGRHGIVFERLSGPTLMEALLERPEYVARTSAEMMAAFHRLPAPPKPQHRLRDALHGYANEPRCSRTRSARG